jgi:NAD(P)-dependent dehydrogenase (short-subunit alcohol dehydrogenase family)
MLQEKSVLITGASRGIGAAAARAFAAAGAKVVLAARDAAACRTLAAEIGGVAVACDVARFADVQAAVDLCRDRFGGVDILINNAGRIEPIAPLTQADPDDWGVCIDVNLKGVFHGLRAALPAMIAQGGGVIVTVSSGASTTPIEGWSAYCAGKAGALMLTRAAHLEAAAAGVRVLGLSPGTVATDMQRAIKASSVDNRVRQLEWSDHIPPEWPARALVWLCGPDGAEFAGGDVSLRDPHIRRRVGLTG